MNELSIISHIASCIRVQLLRLRGAHIGKHVYIGKNVHIRSSHITIGDNCFLLDNISITAKSVNLGENVCIFDQCSFYLLGGLSLGSHSKVSRNCFMRGTEIYAEHDLWCNENVDVGGGGCGGKDAILLIGPHTHIGKGVHINICQPVTIRGYCGIGMGCMIFTHSAGQGQSVFQGYSFIESPVVIGKNVSLYTNTIVTPGTTIEDGVTVGAFSMVRGKLEPEGFYAGIPALQKKAAVHVVDIEEEFLRLLPISTMQNNLPCLPLPNGGSALLINKTPSEYLRDVDIPVFISIDKLYKNEFTTMCRTWICLADKTIHGEATTDSEFLRDVFRRHGTILDPLDGYHFFKLNPFSLRRSGIEQ